VYPPLSGKSRIRVKHPLHTDRVILRLRQQVGPKELLAPKGIRTLDLMELPQRPMPLSLEPTPWGVLLKPRNIDQRAVHTKINEVF